MLCFTEDIATDTLSDYPKCSEQLTFLEKGTWPVKPPDQRWLVFDVEVPSEAGEFLSTLLFEEGCHGIQILESPKTWHALAFFRKEDVKTTLVEELRQRCIEFSRNTGFEGAVKIFCEEIKPEDWERKWRESLRPFKIGRRIVVRPSSCEYHPSEGEIVVTMDPRMAFGSGHHETTKLAVMALEESVSPGSSVLDAGSGTGILAIVAFRLGASKVLAVEVDTTAHENLLENLRLNGLGEDIRTLHVSLADTPAERFDVVVANLDRQGLITNMRAVIRRLKKGGRAFLTGFLIEDLTEIEGTMNLCGLTSVTPIIMGEWAILAGSYGENTGINKS
jgi:ribosomal protein L11 methyltransferase